MTISCSQIHERFSQITAKEREVKQLLLSAKSSKFSKVRIQESLEELAILRDRYDRHLANAKMLDDGRGVWGTDYLALQRFARFYPMNAENLIKIRSTFQDSIMVDGAGRVIGLGLSQDHELNNQSTCALLSLSELSELSCIVGSDSDLNFLQSFKKLTSFSLLSNGRPSIIPLSKLSNLEKLWLCTDCEPDEISRLTSLTNLKLLQFESSELCDLEWACSLTKLENLEITRPQVTNYEVLGQLAKLKALSIYHSKVPIDLRQLATINQLHSLHLFDLAISHFEAIEVLTNLQSLYITNSNLHDLYGLSNLKSLRFLDVTGCRIDDLSPLFGLDTLSVSGVNEAGLNELSRKFAKSRGWIK